jgi:hypothetical protein
MLLMPEREKIISVSRPCQVLRVKSEESGYWQIQVHTEDAKEKTWAII